MAPPAKHLPCKHEDPSFLTRTCSTVGYGGAPLERILDLGEKNRRAPWALITSLIDGARSQRQALPVSKAMDGSPQDDTQ